MIQFSHHDNLIHCLQACIYESWQSVAKASLNDVAFDKSMRGTEKKCHYAIVLVGFLYAFVVSIDVSFLQTVRNCVICKMLKSKSCILGSIYYLALHVRLDMYDGWPVNTVFPKETQDVIRIQGMHEGSHEVVAAWNINAVGV